MSEADIDTKMQNRVMGDISISKSYKGILRIAHIKEEVENQPEIKTNGELNPYYFGEPKKLMDISAGSSSSDEIGYQRPYSAFSGEILRYNKGDAFIDLILPVTDSMGNYLYWNAGQEAFTIGGLGSDKINGYDWTKNNELYFPIIKSENLYVGLTPNILSSQKNVQTLGGLVKIENIDGSNAQIILSNEYDHSSPAAVGKATSDAFDNNFYHRSYNTLSSEGPSFYTILQDTKDSIEDYDSFIYHQDNWDADSFSRNGTIDSVVDVENIVDYVQEKINQFSAQQVVEIPTGTVIWQHASLSKWFNNAITSNNTNDFYKKDAYPTHNPPLQNQVSVLENPLSINTIQGVSRGNSHLQVANPYSGTDFFTMTTNEVIPLYKRDYTLCDGTRYCIYPIRKSQSGSSAISDIEQNDMYDSYERFINLFFCIGFDYTPEDELENSFDFVEKSLTDDEIQKFKFKNNTEFTSSRERDLTKLHYIEKPDRNILFSVEMCKLLAFRALCNERAKDSDSAILDENGQYSRELALEWLKSQKFDERFIFNSFVGMSYDDVNSSDVKRTTQDLLNVIEYEYTNKTLDESVTLYLGREVNSFDSYVITYNYDNSQWNKLICEVWQLAEVQDIIDAFYYINTTAQERQYFLKYFTTKFRVPNMMNDSTGSFIGSSLYEWRDEYHAHTVTSSWSPIVGSEIPHRHAVYATAGTSNDAYVYFQLASNEGVSATHAQLSGDSRVSAEGCYKRGNIPSYEPSTMRDVTKMNYVVAGMDCTYEETKYLNFLNVNVINLVDRYKNNTNYSFLSNGEPNKAPTSSPAQGEHLSSDFKYFWNGQFRSSLITDTSEYGDSYSQNGYYSSSRAEYFVPESIQMLPLIKL